MNLAQRGAYASILLRDTVQSGVRPKHALISFVRHGPRDYILLVSSATALTTSAIDMPSLGACVELVAGSASGSL